MNHLITVLIPTFNDFKAFQRAIKYYSNDQRVKIVVSDDSDDIFERNLIKSKCEEKGFFYVQGTKQLPVDNWNKLMKMIKTPFFVLNHHDEYPLNLSFLDLLDEGDIGLIVLPCTSIARGNLPQKIFSWQQKLFSTICLLYPNASFNMFLAPTASLIINSKLKDILFDNNLKWFVDCDWYCRLILKIRKVGLKIKFFHKSRIISIQAKNSITYSIGKNLKQQINIEKPYLNKKGFLPNRVINFFQFISLVFILFITKFKKIFLAKYPFDNQKLNL